MKKQLLATALVAGVLGAAWPAPNAQPSARADVDLVMRCVGPLLSAQTRLVAVPPECDILFWTNLRPARSWDRSRPVPPGAGATGFPRIPPAPLPMPVPLPRWIYSLGYAA